MQHKNMVATRNVYRPMACAAGDIYC